MCKIRDDAQKEKCKEYQRRHRQNMTDEQRQAAKEKNKEGKIKRRQNMTSEQKQAAKQKDREEGKNDYHVLT